MSTTQPDTTATAQPSVATGYPMAFEVTTLPVADVDRAKAFYLSLGWRLDIDFEPAPDTRGVQITPLGSPASIQFGSGPGAAASGPLNGLLLIVDDIEAARQDLIRRGVDIGEIFHTVPGEGLVPGDRPRAPLVLQPRGLLGSRRQRVAAPGDHRAAPGARVSDHRRGPCTAPARTAIRHGAYEAVVPPQDRWN
jgi:catechol 2,3-dioxygenase-like lactoylglutathione lyase family enzyme